MRLLPDYCELFSCRFPAVLVGSACADVAKMTPRCTQDGAHRSPQEPTGAQDGVRRSPKSARIGCGLASRSVRARRRVHVPTIATFRANPHLILRLGNPTWGPREISGAQPELAAEAVRSPKSARIGWGLASRSLRARRRVHVGEECVSCPTIATY